MNKGKEYIEKLSAALSQIDHEKIEKLIKLLSKYKLSQKTIFICGNGGSASTSSHMACDLGKTTMGKKKRSLFRVASLNDNVAILTAFANDFGYEYVFSERLKNLAKKGDFLIVISASGNSPNILEALKAAKALKLKTFGLLGFGGGKAKKIVDDCLIVDSFDYGVVEDVHHAINHLITNHFKNN